MLCCPSTSSARCYRNRQKSFTSSGHVYSPQRKIAARQGYFYLHEKLCCTSTAPLEPSLQLQRLSPKNRELTFVYLLQKHLKQLSLVMIPRHTVRIYLSLLLVPHSSSPYPTVGRLRHFASITSPLTLLASSSELAEAQKFLKEYQEGVGKGRQAWGKEEEMGVWKAKQLVDSSLHPGMSALSTLALSTAC